MKIIGVFVVLFFAMIEDVQDRKIRNVWVILVFLLCLFMSLDQGIQGISFYFGKVSVWFLVMFMLYRIGGVGAGDVKLLSVLAAGLASSDAKAFWASTLLCALALSIWTIVVRGRRESIPLALPIWFGYLTMFVSKGGAII